MPIPDLDHDFTETDRAVKETAHRFAAEVMRPVGEALDKLPAADVISQKSAVWDVFGQFQALGLNDLDPDLSPLEQSRLQFIVLEEMGWGDSGLAISLGVSTFPTEIAAMTGRTDLMERFPSGEVGCWAITEPDHGSDMVDFDNALIAPGGKRSAPNIVARAEGNEFVISGQKSSWVSNGTTASTAALFCAVEMPDGTKGNGVFLARIDEDAITRGKPLEKIGQRALNQGEIFFDGLRIPADNLVAGPDEYAAFTDMTLCRANGMMATTFSGTARAAFELALDYAKTRIQGGVPIIEHQSVKTRIFNMYKKVVASRALAYSVVLRNDTSEQPALAAAIAAKTVATQAAFDVASDALQIFGGNGISREYPIEKIFRDARISMIEDGCNEVLGLTGAGRLASD